MPLPKKFQDLLFVDTETTGLDHKVHELLEVAALRCSFDGKQIISAYEAKLKPLHIETATAKALEINGYTPEEWTDEKCTPHEAVVQHLSNMARDTVLVGQNVSFDEGFLNDLFDAHKVKPPWGYHKVDTVALGWPLFINTPMEGLSLGKMCAFLGVSQMPTHRAAADVAACREIYLRLMAKWAGACNP